MKKRGKIALLAAVVLGIGMSVSYAHIVPGWDEPYDPPNYYSPTNISIPDSAPSPFALRELMRGDVYDYTRHIKSILFGDHYADIYQNLFAQLMNEIRDMTGMNKNAIARTERSVEDGFGSSKDIGATSDIPYLEEQSLFRKSSVDPDEFDDVRQLKWAGEIYLKSLNADKEAQADLEERFKAINEVLENSAAAQGNMEAVQAQTQMSALANAEISRRNALLANYAATEAAHSRLQLDQDLHDVQAARKGSAFKVIDRDHLTPSDRLIYVERTAPGYYDF